MGRVRGLINNQEQTMLFKEITFNSDDYSKTLKLRSKILRVPLGKILSEEDLEGEKDQLHFGVFDSIKLVACVVIKPIKNGSIGKLRQMAVDESAQGKGLGKLIIIEAELILKNKGFQQITMAARETAIGFYQKLGYQIIGDMFLEQGIEHIEMVKKL